MCNKHVIKNILSAHTIKINIVFKSPEALKLNTHCIVRVLSICKIILKDFYYVFDHFT